MLFKRWTGARVLKRWMQVRVIVLPKRDLNYKLKQVSNEVWEKKFWIFLGLSVRENPDKTRLTSSSFSDPLWFASLCWWPLFSLFSGALCISFSRCSSLDIRDNSGFWWTHDDHFTPRIIENYQNQSIIIINRSSIISIGNLMISSTIWNK